MRTSAAILCQTVFVLATVSAVVCGAQPDDPKQAAVLAKYRQWERDVPAGSTLARLKPLLERKYTVLPPEDLEDRSPLPLWFRIYMRLQQPDLRTSGPAQYGRNANRILQELLDEPNHPDLTGMVERLERER